MALSKWFLCGAEGAFEKDESLAFTFAEKAARKGLPSAEFAMGYYKEVGVGGTKDIEAARMWYQLASDHGNTDATERLGVLSQPSPQALSRQEHDNITESKLVRKRTQAKQRSERESGVIPRASIEESQQVVDVIRRNSVVRHHAPASSAGSSGLTPLTEQTPNPMSPQVQPVPGPQAQPHRQFPNQHRYTLVDPGSAQTGNSPPPSRTDQPGYARPAGRPPGQRTQTFPSPAPPQGPPQDQNADGGSQPPSARQAVKGPMTFAEMGIQAKKLESNQDCMIM